MKPRLSTGLVILAALGGAAPAQSAPTCASLTNPVYLQVGDSQASLMLALGRALRDNAPDPITLVYTTSGSCINVDLAYNGSAIGGGSSGSDFVMSYVPSTAEDATWTPAAGPESCSLPAGGVAPDIAGVELFPSACTSTTPPSTVALTQGPTQAYVLAVPRGGNTLAITAEQGYFLFGFGPTMLAAMNAAISPWTELMELFVRGSGQSIQLAWGASLGVPATAFYGVIEAGSAAVTDALESAATPTAAIGLLAATEYDGARDRLQSLAYRTYHQWAAYYPDSTSTSRDKQNVRDGHYTVWSPTIWIDFVDGGGVPINANARYVIDLIAGLDPTAYGAAPNFAAQDTVASVGFVPDCAMRVTRMYEGGPLSAYKPSESCTCEYESIVDVSSCATCSASVPCAGSAVCRGGYCEEY